MRGTARNLKEVIKRNIQKKYVFLACLSQVEKQLSPKCVTGPRGKYLLYEDVNDRRIILNKEFIHEKWVCLDAFHKFKRWKNNIKSMYDKYHEELHLTFTGRTRLDLYQRSGDSLY